LYGTTGYTPWDLIKNNTYGDAPCFDPTAGPCSLPPLMPLTKYSVHVSNSLAMLPFNGVSSAAKTAMANLEFADATGYFSELPLHSEFEVELFQGEYLPNNFSASMPAMQMYKSMLNEYSYSDSVQKVVATPFACTFAGRRIIHAVSTVLGYANGGFCPSPLHLFGLLREIKEAIFAAQKAHAWRDVGTTGAAIYAVGVFDGAGYAAMTWYYRSIMTTAIAAMNAACGATYDVAWVGFFIGLKYDLASMQTHLINMHMGP